MYWRTATTRRTKDSKHAPPTVEGIQVYVQLSRDTSVSIRTAIQRRVCPERCHVLGCENFVRIDRGLRSRFNETKQRSRNCAEGAHHRLPLCSAESSVFSTSPTRGSFTLESGVQDFSSALSLRTRGKKKKNNKKKKRERRRGEEILQNRYP